MVPFFVVPFLFGVNTIVDDQEIASSNSGTMGGTPNVSAKAAPQKNLRTKDLKASGHEADVFDEEYWKDAEEINLTRMTPAQLVGIEKAYWAKNRENQK